MRKLSNSTKAKVLRIASEILAMHGSVAGNRTCQAWSGDASTSPNNILSESELNDISFNYELSNSGGEDFEEGESYLNDEMVASFAMSVMLGDMIKDYE